MENQDLFELADMYYEARQDKEQKEQIYKDACLIADQLEKELLEKMTDNELDNFKRNGIQYSAVTREYLSANPETKVELYKRFKEKGFESLFTINANTLSGFVKERIRENDNVMPTWLEGLINTFEKQSIRIRKG